MKLKLKHDEFIALHDMFRDISHKYGAQDFWDKLLHVISTNVFLKMYKMAVYKKPKYTLKLSEPEAIAFWILTNDHKLGDSTFLGNLLNTINYSIHQTYTV